MAEVVAEKATGLLPTVAAHVAIWFPELNGRSIAVSEAQITKENLPDLPLVMVSLAREQNEDRPSDASKSLLNLRDNFVIEFWMEPARIKRGNGTETPFWSYYDYETIRSRLLAGLTGGYLGPSGERISYLNMTIESDAFSVVITFTFAATFQWCAPANLKQACAAAIDATGDGEPITPNTFRVSVCKPQTQCVKGFGIDCLDPTCDRCKPILDAAAQREIDSRPQGE